MAAKKVSATQLNKFDDTLETGCQRRWAFQYIWKLPDPAGAGAELGSKVHDHLERFVRDGVVFPVAEKSGKLAFQLLDYCVEVRDRPGLEVERNFVYHEGGVVYTGKVDIRCLHPTGMSWVRDWKTSANPGQCGLRPHTMMDDTQAVMYARQELEREDIERRDKLMLDWVYVKTRPPKEDPIVCRGHFTREQVELAWPRVHRLGERVTEARQTIKDPNDLPANRKACWAYRKPCPYMDKCHGAMDEKRIIRDFFAKEKAAKAQPQLQEDSKMSTKAQQILEARRKRQGRAAPEKSANESTGLDPAKAQAAYDKKEAEEKAAKEAAAKAEEKAPEVTEEQRARAEQVNAPEQGHGDDETQKGVSKFVALVTERNPGRGKAKEAREAYQRAMAEAISEGKTPEEGDAIAREKAGLDEDHKRITKKSGGSKKTTTVAAVAGGPVDPSDAWLQIFCAIARDQTLSAKDMAAETEVAFKIWEGKFGSR